MQMDRCYDVPDHNATVQMKLCSQCTQAIPYLLQRTLYPSASRLGNRWWPRLQQSRWWWRRPNQFLLRRSPAQTPKVRRGQRDNAFGIVE